MSAQGLMEMCKVLHKKEKKFAVRSDYETLPEEIKLSFRINEQISDINKLGLCFDCFAFEGSPNDDS